MEPKVSPLPADLMLLLAEPFELDQHDVREQTRKDRDRTVVTGYLTYIPIDQVIQRLNEVFGPWWTEEVVQVSAVGDPLRPMIWVHLRIRYQDSLGQVWFRDGLGAAQFNSSSADLDQVVKTAQAEALKKAAHQFGVGGYLWDRATADELARLILARRGQSWAASARKPARFLEPKPLWLVVMADAVGAAGSGIQDRPTEAERPELSAEAKEAWHGVNQALQALIPDSSQPVRREVARLLLKQTFGQEANSRTVSPGQLHEMAAKLLSEQVPLGALVSKASSNLNRWQNNGSQGGTSRMRQAAG